MKKRNKAAYRFLNRLFDVLTVSEKIFSFRVSFKAKESWVDEIFLGNLLAEVLGNVAKSTNAFEFDVKKIETQLRKIRLSESIPGKEDNSTLPCPLENYLPALYSSTYLLASSIGILKLSAIFFATNSSLSLTSSSIKS